MNTKRKVWFVIEKSLGTRSPRASKDYEDITGKFYNYDSKVQNSRNLQINDIIIIRKENSIDGYGTISNIKLTPSFKIIKRCPECNSPDINERRTKYPRWRCRCTSTFEMPNETKENITAYSAEITNYKTIKKDSLSVNKLKSCALKGEGTKSQISMMQLDIDKAKVLIPSLIPSQNIVQLEKSTYEDNIIATEKLISQSLLNKSERKIITKYRLEQSFFREQLIIYWNGCCSISGFDKTEILIASHIKPYSKCKQNEKYDKYNGLLLTPNYDKLFDNYLISFNKDGKILISKELSKSQLKKLNINEEAVLKVEEQHKKYLKYHRKKFLKKQVFSILE